MEVHWNMFANLVRIVVLFSQKGTIYANAFELKRENAQVQRAERPSPTILPYS